MPADPLSRAASDERLDLTRTAREHDFWPLYRELEGRAGPVVAMEGRERIMLGSNNYLGLTGDRRVVDAAQAALERYGTGMTGSRLLNGTLALHTELEQEIASWYGTEAALVFTTGYQANLGLLSALMRPGDRVVCDSANHASIIDGVSLSGAELRPFRHGRVDRLERALGRIEDDAGALVIVDGVFSMEGDVADLPPIADACARHGVPLVVDEAHAIGVLGERGVGTCEALGIEDRVALRVGTFSKSLASCGGFVAGPADVLEYLRIEARPLLFTAAGVPPALAAALAAIRICRSSEGCELMAQLRGNALRLERGLTDLGFTVISSGEETVTPIVPILIGDEVEATCLWKALYDSGVYVNLAGYPAVPRDRALLRASVMATHEPEHLDSALAAFERVKEEAAADAFVGA